MRYLRDIQHPTHKISLYQWNGKYLLKFEAGSMYEQIYKIDETDIASETEIDSLADALFTDQVNERFRNMHQDFMASLRRNDILL